MSLYVRLNCNFFTHRKTAKLRAALGRDALWLVPRIWAYAAENQPDGVFEDYSAAELANLIGYEGDVQKMLEALLQAGFMDSNPLRIHDWEEYNAYHKTYADRARHAAAARWKKERSKEKRKENRGEDVSNASSITSKPNSILHTSSSNKTTSSELSRLKDWQLRKDRNELIKGIAGTSDRQMRKVLRAHLNRIDAEMKSREGCTDPPLSVRTSEGGKAVESGEGSIPRKSKEEMLNLVQQMKAATDSVQ